MIDVAYLDVLRTIEARLARRDVTWVITGSTGFALQGLDFDPDDIDLQTDRAGAFAIEDALADYRIDPVRFRSSDKIRSHFGSVAIEGVRVEIMGDIQKRRLDGGWSEPPDLTRHRRWVEVYGLLLPVLSLAYEHEAYLMLGRTSTAQRIKAWLDARSD